MPAPSPKRAPTAHRIDLPCDRTGFATPPSDVHLKLLPEPGGWLLVGHAAPGAPAKLAAWLQDHASVGEVEVEPGFTPRILHARLAKPPAAWEAVARRARVHHLNLAANGLASWFVEGDREAVWSLVQDLAAAPARAEDPGVRWRPVHARSAAPMSRRQFEALATAVALGYYEIPHRVDLRALAQRLGISIASAGERLRRGEGAVITHYVDASLLGWPVEAAAPTPYRTLDALLRA